MTYEQPSAAASASGEHAEVALLLERAQRRGCRLRRLRRLAQGTLAVGIAAVVATAALLLTGASGSRTGAGALTSDQLVSFTRTAGEIEVRITHPLVAAQQLETAFRAHHLHVKLTAVPVPPADVGKIFGAAIKVGDPSQYSASESVRAIFGKPCMDGGTCWVGFKFPASGAGGLIRLEIGRFARPGEPYDGSGPLFSIGGPLYCSGVPGEPMRLALPQLESTGYTIRWQYAGHPQSPIPPTSGYVVTGWFLGEPITSSRTEIQIQVNSTPPSTKNGFLHVVQVEDRGC